MILAEAALRDLDKCRHARTKHFARLGFWDDEALLRTRVDDLGWLLCTLPLAVVASPVDCVADNVRRPESVGSLCLPITPSECIDNGGRRAMELM